MHNVQGKVDIPTVLTEDAMVLITDRLATADVIHNIPAPDLDALEPRLTRHGYNTKVLAELLNAKPREIKALFRGQLASGRAQEIQHELLAIGIPL